MVTTTWQETPKKNRDRAARRAWLIAEQAADPTKRNFLTVLAREAGVGTLRVRSIRSGLRAAGMPIPPERQARPDDPRYLCTDAEISRAATGDYPRELHPQDEVDVNGRVTSWAVWRAETETETETEPEPEPPTPLLTARQLLARARTQAQALRATLDTLEGYIMDWPEGDIATHVIHGRVPASEAKITKVQSRNRLGRCVFCGRIKPESQFGFLTDKKAGVVRTQPRCRACRR